MTEKTRIMGDMKLDITEYKARAKMEYVILIYTQA